jgi:hypothetical protein
MPRLKVEDDEFDINELEGAEYSEDEEYADYEGPTPPKKTVLNGYVKVAYWTLDSSGERMIKSLFIAAENTGDRAKFNGCPIWDNTSFKASTKFRWVPLIRAWDITLQDIKKKLYVLPEEDDHPTFGAVIEKIGTWKPGEDEDTAYCRVLTGVHNYDGGKIVDVGKWLPWQDAQADADEDDEVADEAEDEEEQDVDEEPEEDEEAAEDEDQDAEEEDEEPPAKPARRAPARTAKAAPAKSAAAKPATRGAKPAAASRPATGRKAASKPAATRRGARAQGSDDDPPF